MEVLTEDLERLRDAQIPVLRLLTEMVKQGEAYTVGHQERLNNVIRQFELLDLEIGKINH